MRGRAAAVLGLVLALAACTGSGEPDQDPGTDDPAETPEEAGDDGTGAIRMAAVGDSITDADSPDFAAGELGPQSWASYAVGDDVEFAGGWARWGALTAEMAENVEPVDADVLVILAGTNDLAGPVNLPDIGENLVVIAANAEVETVVLSSVPPLDGLPEGPEELNAFYEGFAAEQGWTFVDSAEGIRDGDRFAPGMAYDGVHPTEAGAEVIGEAIGAAVLDAGSG